MTQNRLLSLLLLFVLSAVASPGLARVPGGHLDEIITTDLEIPTSFAFLPDGRILVTEQSNRKVLLVVQGVVAANPVLVLADVDTTLGERGLVGIAVHPDWPSPAQVFVCFTPPVGTGMVVRRYTATGDLTDGFSESLSLGSPYDILNDIPDDNDIHNAGTLRFGPNKMLYVSTGDDAQGSEFRERACSAQDTTSLQGAILRLDVSSLPGTGSGPPPKSLLAPSDNPFPGGDPVAALVFAKGLRNPFRFTIDPEEGGVYIGDVGASNWEEVDEAFGGENFGWPLREGPDTLSNTFCPEPFVLPYVPPIDSFQHVEPGPAVVVAGPRYRVSVGGPEVYNCAYDGTLFFTDYYSGIVRALRKVNGSWEPHFVEIYPGVWAEKIYRVVDMQQGPDGAIYYLQQYPGRLRRIRWLGGPGDCNQVGVPPDPLITQSRIIASPNPFRIAAGGLTIHGPAGSLEIYDVAGRRVQVLAASAEGLVRRWNGRDGAGRPVAPGIYLIRGRDGDRPVFSRVLVLP